MTHHASRRRGLSIIEVLVALVVVGIAFAILSTALVGNLRNTERAGTRTQTTQYLNYLGRQVSGGMNNAVLPPAGDTFSWGYGALGAAFPDLPGGTGTRNDANRYRAAIESLGAFTFAGASSVRYSITVCTESSTGEACVSGTTLSSPPHTGTPSGVTTGLN